MQVVTKDEIKLNREHYKSRIKKGSVFIHPTDTIYGLGCNACDNDAVARIRTIKGREEGKPFSIIAPSKSWIRIHCVVDDEVESWLEKLPGPYTLVLRLKDAGCLSEEVTKGKRSIGVRIPDHWISEAVSKFMTPMVTTSVNRAGEEFMTSLDDLDATIRSQVDFIIYEDEKNGQPSTLVNLAGEEIRAVKRKVI